MAKEVLLKGSTPLHFAVHMRSPQQVQCLLQAGADPSMLDEKNQTAYRYARVLNDENIVVIFQQHRLYAHKLRVQTRAKEVELDQAKRHILQFQADQKVLTHVRKTLMTQVVSLWWRYTASMVRRNLVTKQKDAMAQQLETLVTASTAAMKTMEADKATLTDQRIKLQEEKEELRATIDGLEAELAKCRREMAERGVETADRQALRGEIQSLQSALKQSLELYAGAALLVLDWCWAVVVLTRFALCCVWMLGHDFRARLNHFLSRLQPFLIMYLH